MNCRRCGGRIAYEDLFEPNERRFFCLACGRDQEGSQPTPRPRPVRHCLKGHTLTGRNVTKAGQCVQCSRARAVATKPSEAQVKAHHHIIAAPSDRMKLGKELKP